MRWTWLIPRLILVTLLWAVFAFGFDPWLRQTAVQSVQSVTGARADIATLTTGFFPPVLSVQGVALASAGKPGTNLIEFDELQCRLGGQALLRRSLVIEEARLTGVRLGTVRNDDGQLQEEPVVDDGEPSWLTEKLREAGDEWLQQLVLDVRQQLDPNTLETWRTGQTLSVKWEQRMEQLQEDLKALQPRVDQLQQQMDEAKKLRSVARIDRYLQLAGEGEQLLREAQEIQNRIQNIVPEVRQDLTSLDQARRNDQQMVVQKIQQLKPSPRRITESLIGPEMYRQLHQALSWLQMGKEYRQQLKQQTQVVRHRGEDFEFPVLNPTPRFLCRQLQMTGELTVDQQLMPFEAVLSDVSSDPVLTGQPTMFRLTATGDSSLHLAIRHDATSEQPTTDVLAEIHGTQTKSLRIGEEKSALLTAGLAGVSWSARIRMQDDQIRGLVQLTSSLQQAHIASAGMSPVLKVAIVDILRGVDSVDAAVQVTGTLQRPEVRLDSRLGEQVAAGLQAALSSQAERAKSELASQVTQIAAEQKDRLSAELNGRYQELVADHRATFEKIQGAQRLLASVRSGSSDPVDLFRQVSGSGLLPTKQQEQLDQQMKKRDQLLQGIGNGIFR